MAYGQIWLNSTSNPYPYDLTIENNFGSNYQCVAGFSVAVTGTRGTLYFEDGYAPDELAWIANGTYTSMRSSQTGIGTTSRAAFSIWLDGNRIGLRPTNANSNYYKTDMQSP